MSGNRHYLSFLVLSALGMLWLQWLDAPTLSDDMAYRFVWQSDEEEALTMVSSISDLLQSQWVHYQIVNGRWVFHTLGQFFLCLTSPVVYQVISALMYVMVLMMSVQLIGAHQRDRLFAAVSICFLLFVVSSGVSTTMLWSMGTFNYLWVTFFTLLFLLSLRRLGKETKTVHWLIAPLSLLVGNGHEAISLPISITFMVYILNNRKTVVHRPVFLFMVWYIVGMLTCLASPALWLRADGGITLFSRLLSGVVNIVFNLKISWLLLLTLIYLFIKDKSHWKLELKQNRYVYLCLTIALGIVFLCGTNLDRVVFFADFIALLLLVRLWIVLSTDRWKTRVTIFFSVIMFIVYVPVVVLRQQNIDCYRYISAQMQQPGKDLISVRQPPVGTNVLMDYLRRRYVNPTAEFGFYCCYMAFNAEDINMREAAALYGKSRMVFLPEDVVSRIATDSTAYRHYEQDEHQKLFVWRLREGTAVKRLRFLLKPEDPSTLLPHQRLLAYRDDTYELDDYRYSIVNVSGRSYLVFTCPTTNIMRRLGDIVYDVCDGNRGVGDSDGERYGDHQFDGKAFGGEEVQVDEANEEVVIDIDTERVVADV